MITKHLAPYWTRIGSVQDIPVLGSRRVTRTQALAVGVFALLDRHAHKGGAMYLDKDELATLAIDFTRPVAGPARRVTGV